MAFLNAKNAIKSITAWLDFRHKTKLSYCCSNILKTLVQFFNIAMEQNELQQKYIRTERYLD